MRFADASDGAAHQRRRELASILLSCEGKSFWSAKMTQSLAPKTDRLVHLDVLRGLAVLGLLFARFPAKGGSSLVLEHPDVLGWSAGEQGLWLFNSVMVDDAMRGLFALLFGVSLWMMTGPREDRSLVPTWTGYLARTAGLFLFGLTFHVIALAEASDILHVYALAACGALILSRLDARLLLLGGMVGFVLLAAHDFMGDITTAPVTSAALAHAAAEREAGYLAHILASIQNFQAWSLSTGIVWKCLEAGSYMLLGLGLFRIGFFTCLSNETLALITAAAYGVGLAVCGGVAISLAAGGFMESVKAHFLTTLGKPFIVIAHASLIMLLMRGGFMRTVLTGVLAPVGRMALTLYLAGSAIALFAFTGAGLGLGPFDRYEITGLAVLGSLFLIVAARAWLSAFNQGPFEWALRIWSQKTGGFLVSILPGMRLQSA